MKGSVLNRMSEEGVSETIGAVLLIGLTVVGVTLVSVILFSQPLAEELPAVDIIVSNNDTTVLFQHNGGDSLGRDDFTIFVEGNAVDPDELHVADSGDGEWPWSVGETLQYSAVLGSTPLSDNVRMTYGGDSGILIRPAFVDEAGTNENRVDVVPGPLPVYTPGATQTPSPAEAGVYVAESVLRDSQIIAAFAVLEKTAVVENKFFNFTIVSPNSTISTAYQGSGGTTNWDLNTGDTIAIRTGLDNAAGNRISVTGVGNTFFSFRFERVNLWINGSLIPGGSKDELEILSGWIPEYENLESTLEFRLDPTYELYIDGAIDPRSGSATTITMENVRPTDSGMFVINAWSPNDNENSVLLVKADGL